MRTEVAIFGAGVSGLAAGDYLSARGAEIVIIEKESEAGGMCRSFKKRGFTFDLGGHRFLSKNHLVLDYIHSLFSHDSEELVLQVRKSQIYLQGRYLAYPPEFLDILKNLGIITCLKGGRDSLYLMLKDFFKKDSDLSLKGWILNRFGPTLYGIYFNPYSIKLWGRDPANISSEWAPQRISVPNVGVALKNLILEDTRCIKSYARKFLYPKGGIAEIPKRMEQKIEKRGARILKNHKVIKVSAEKEGFLITLQTNGSEHKEVSAKKIISTMPLNEFLDLLTPGPEPDIHDIARGLSFRSVRFLNLMLVTPKVFKNTWLYVPENEYIFFRIQELSNWHITNCPPGKTALSLEIACDKGDDIWEMEDKELFDICVKDLDKIGIHIADKIEGYFCAYAEYGYPVYSLRYKEDLAKLYKYIGSLNNVVVAGRQGLFRYLDIDAAIDSGFLAAKSLCNGMPHKNNAK